jgi:hypothetical protein
VGLPPEVVQAVPVVPWEVSDSYPGNIDTSPPIVPFWIRLIQGDPGVIAEMLQWFHSALVAVYDAAVKFF